MSFEIEFYTQHITQIITEMYDSALLDSISMDTKEGRLIMLEKYIGQIAYYTDIVKDNNPDGSESNVRRMAFLEANMKRYDCVEDKVYFIFTHFLTKYSLAPSPDFKSAAICFCMPILVDAWNCKI